ncbi:hypothetical protein Moror_2569 [Moniliophthora roreri MCA 2997]|nr:hypothetical protein Moror_2569 [Moniliophthora roreri MCA 2997]
MSKTLSELERKYTSQSSLIETLEDEMDELKDENERMKADLRRFKARVRLLEQENERLWKNVCKLSGPVFPKAIVARVISFLREDRQALKFCGLTCKRWLLLSRPYLFERIRINPTTNAEMFTTLLQHPRQEIASHVQILQLDGGVASKDPNVPREWLQPLVDQLHTFTRVSTLQIRDINHLWFTTESKSWKRLWTPIPFLRQITHLDIEDPLGLLDDMTQLSDLFPSLTSLTGLRLTEPKTSSRKVINFTAKEPPKTLSVLKLTKDEHSTCAHHQLWIWFTLTGARTLRNVELDMICARDFPSIGDCFYVIGKNLERLVIDGFLDVESIRQFSRHQVLGKCEKLTELRIRPNGRGQSSSVNEAKGAIDILGTMPARNALSRVTLSLHAEDFPVPNDKSAAVFSELDYLLTGIRFMGMSRIEVEMKADGRMAESLDATIRLLLPNCSEQGMLLPIFHE